MLVETTAIDGALLFTPQPHADDRGWFSRTWDDAIAAEHGIGGFVQDSQSRSRRGVIRGMHVRAGGGEAKYVRCAAGAMVDVVVDLRRDSPTFLARVMVRLDDENHRGLYVPRGCAHGWQALSEPTDVCYRIDATHDPSEDVSIRFDDPDLAVPWPDPAGFVSEKDRGAGTLAEALARLSS